MSKEQRIIKHTALVCATEENADRFYANLLGLKKLTPKNLARSLSKAIFDVDSEMKVINYMNEDVCFEIFIYNQINRIKGRIEHVCIEIDDHDVFMKRCQTFEVKIIRIPKKR